MNAIVAVAIVSIMLNPVLYKLVGTVEHARAAVELEPDSR